MKALLKEIYTAMFRDDWGNELAPHPQPIPANDEEHTGTFLSAEHTKNKVLPAGFHDLTDRVFLPNGSQDLFFDMHSAILKTTDCPSPCALDTLTVSFRVHMTSNASVQKPKRALLFKVAVIDSQSRIIAVGDALSSVHQKVGELLDAVQIQCSIPKATRIGSIEVMAYDLSEH